MKKLFTSVLALLAAVCLYATDLNIYASGLNATQTSSESVTIEYVLNAPATSLKVKFYDGQTLVATVPVPAGDANANYTKGAHKGANAVVVNLSTVPTGTYTWAIEAVGASHAQDLEVSATNVAIGQSASRGMALDDDPESPWFGTLYLLDRNSTGRLLSVPADLSSMTTLVSAAESWTTSTSSPMRLAIGEDGLLYTSDWSDGTPNVVVIDRSDNSSSVVFGGTTSGSGIYKNGNTIIHGSMTGLFVTGSGASRVLYTIDEDMKDASGNINIYKYAIGELTSPWVSAPTAVAYANNPKKMYTNDGNANIFGDGHGGMWVAVHRFSDSSGYPALFHVDATGAVDYTSNGGVVDNNNFGSCASLFVTHDKSLVVTSWYNKIRVWRPTFTGDAVASVSLVKEFTSSVSTSTYCVAIDPAGNVYQLGDNNLLAYAPATDNNSHETPAKVANTIESTGNVKHVTDVSLESSASVELGKTTTLVPTVNPADATDKSVTWSSNNESVATVEDGVVTGVAVGEAVITATTTDLGYQATCTVTVYMNHVTAVNITPSSFELSLAFPNKAPLTATILPENATDKTFTWSSSDETIVTIDQNGVVTPVAEGTATIYATAADGDIQGTCPVTVSNPAAVAHISAWGLHSEKTQTGYKFLFNTNMAANSASIVFYDKASGNLLNEVPVTVIAGENVVNVAAEDMPGCINQELTWAVRLSGADNAAFSKIFESAEIGGRGHLVVDASPESDYMGRTYFFTRNNATVGGMYIFDQQYTVSARYNFGSNFNYGFMRPSIDETGMVWAADWRDECSGIWLIDPANPNVKTQFFQGTRDINTGLFTNNSTEVGGSSPACFIYGTGENRKLFTVQEDFTGLTGSDLGNHPVAIYNIGTAYSWGDAPTAVYKTPNNSNTNDGLYVVEHGYWVSQNRSAGQNTSGVPALQFFSMDGTLLVNFGGDPRINGCAGSGFTINPYTGRLYMVDGSSNILEFDVTYNAETHVPTLDLIGKYYVGYDNISSMCFDFAGNLHVVAGPYGTASSNKMRMVVFSPSTNGNNTTLVPAKAADVVKPFFGTLYEFGSNQEWHTGVGDGVAMTRVSDDVFAGEFTFTGESYFTFSGYSGSDDESPWSVINTRRLSAPSGNKAISAENNDELVLGGENSFKIAAGTYIIKVNTAEMKVYVNSKIVVENLYEVGNNQDWKAAEALPMTKVADNVFQGDFAFTNALSYFAFTATPGANNDDWDAVNTMRFGGTNADLVSDGDVAVPVVKGDGNTNFTILPGTYRLRVDLNTRTLDVTRLGDAIQVSNVGYATYYNSAEAYTMPEGMEGYYFNTTDGLALKYEAGANVAADVALVLKADAGRYPLVYAESGNVAIGTNQLLGTDEETALVDDADYNFYALSLNAAGDLNSVGFYWMVEDNGRGAAFTNGAHKAYLKLLINSGSEAPQRYYLFHGENNTTNIVNVKNANEAVKFIENGQIYILRDGVIYDATGRRVR